MGGGSIRGRGGGTDEETYMPNPSQTSLYKILYRSSRSHVPSGTLFRAKREIIFPST
jgi:hypothetical protein